MAADAATVLRHLRAGLKELGGQRRDESADTHAGGWAYARLTAVSGAFSRVVAGSPTPHLWLVLPELGARSLYAGVKTSLETAAIMHRRTGMPLRVVALRMGSSRKERESATAVVAAVTGLPPDSFSVSSPRDRGMAFHPSDIWLVTHWTTAHAAHVAALDGSVDAGRVVYLIQDSEADFLPASADRELARWTYRAGFVPLVNSRPLADHLRSSEGVKIADGAVFAPALDVARLSDVASRRRYDQRTVRVFFYGRPAKPRNMFELGVAALRLLASGHAGAVEGPALQYVSAGERHRDVRLAEYAHLRSLGHLGWDEYYRELGRADVVLALQASVHPSHVPLDAAVSGATVVTNEVAASRAGLHPRIIAAAADPVAIAEALAAAVERSRTGQAGVFAGLPAGLLGGELADAVDHALAGMR